jgi:antitoxin component of MazEF toxin-antitoxin module
MEGFAHIYKDPSGGARIYLPKKISEQIDFKNGDVLKVQLEDSKIVLKFLVVKE